MTRAYLRLDPSFDERKADYPDGAYAALVGTLCLAEFQPHRGRFRSVPFLKALLGRRGRWVRYLAERGDIAGQPDGTVYVVGWDEWQEGDWKVADRMARVRNGRSSRGQRRDRAATPLTVASATAPATEPAMVDRYVAKGIGRENSGSGSAGVSNSGGSSQPPRLSDDRPFREKAPWRI